MACMDENELMHKLFESGKRLEHPPQSKDDLVQALEEIPSRENSHIFNVGNPYNEVTVKQLAEIMTEAIGHHHLLGLHFACDLLHLIDMSLKGMRPSTSPKQF